MTRLLTPTGAYRAWVTVAMVIASLVVAVGLTIGYVAKARAQDDRRWCDLLGTLTQPQPTAAPQTPQGRQVAAKLQELYREFGCARR